MIVPLFVGREKSIRALEEVMKGDKPILLATQKNAADDDPAPDAIFETGTLARVLQLLKLPDGTVKVLVEGASRAKIRRYLPTEGYYAAEAEAIADDPIDEIEAEALSRSVLSEFENYVKLNKKISPEVVAAVTPDRRLRQARRHDRLASGGQARRQAGDPRDPFDRQALREVPRADGERDLGAAGREAHPHARQAADGEDAARILSQRADEGDPEGTRRRGRQGRDVRAGEPHQGDQAHQGSARQGARRAQEAQADVADVGRGDGGAQLSRLDAVDPVAEEVEDQEGPACRAGDPRQRPLRPREGQGAHRRVPGGAAARQQADRPDPVPRRPARRRQDLARQVDRQGDGPRVRAHVARRRARRGGDPRPPAHLHRLDAGQGDPVDAQGQDLQPALPARRDRQDGHGLPRRSVVGAARGARPRAELRRSTTITSRSTTTCRT